MLGHHNQRALFTIKHLKENMNLLYVQQNKEANLCLYFDLWIRNETLIADVSLV